MNQNRRVGVLAVAGLLLVSACAGGSSVESETATGGSTDESVTTTTGAGDDETLWGPLAVVQAGNAGLDALIEGTIRITDECVLLEERGDMVLLVWPSNRIQWDKGSATVQFTDPNSGPVTIEDGQVVRLGGGGTSVNEGGLGAQEWLDSIKWIAEPPLSCVTDTRWSVSGVLN